MRERGGPVMACLRVLVRTAAGVLVAAALGGCASMEPPKPWEKQYLAKPAMQFDADASDARTTQHIYQSKEGASGGYGAGGGGCGCN
jgi:hypothetical protein